MDIYKPSKYLRCHPDAPHTTAGLYNCCGRTRMPTERDAIQGLGGLHGVLLLLQRQPLLPAISTDHTPTEG